MSKGGNGDQPAEQDAPKIEFPCLYPIKIIGIASVSFQEEVTIVVEKHTGKISSDLIELQASKKKTYVSIRITIAATGVDQLQALFDELKAMDSVKMVL
jgi:putative lipoic acid-binding regulatory protein